MCFSGAHPPASALSRDPASTTRAAPAAAPVAGLAVAGLAVAGLAAEWTFAQRHDVS